jgi:lipopolysaccharide export LptBFGC system permease protein LptF
MEPWCLIKTVNCPRIWYREFKSSSNSLKLLHRHILSSHVVTLTITLLVFTFILLVSNVMKDALSILSNQTVGFGIIFQFVGLLIPYALSFSMPMALLAATLLVMGRLSADNELTAARASGISFMELVLPMVGVATFLCFACFYINGFVAPKTRWMFNQAFVEVAFKEPLSLLEEGTYIKEFPDLVIFIGKRDLKEKTLENVRITKMLSGEMTEEIYAEKGKVTSDLNLMQIKILLENVTITQRDPINPTNIEKRRWGAFSETYPLDLDLTRLVDQRRTVKDDQHFTSWELWQQIVDLKRQSILATPKLVELHRRSALALAPLAFVMIAIPLGVQVQRRETSIGILVSLILAVLWYFLIVFAQGLKDKPQYYPELILWVPNLLFQLIGGVLLWRQNQV